MTLPARIHRIKPGVSIEIRRKMMRRTLLQRRNINVRYVRRNMLGTSVLTNANGVGKEDEGCWTKFPQKAPGYRAPSVEMKKPKRGGTPAPPKKQRGRRSRSLGGSDRASSYDASGSDSGSPHGNKKKRHRSKRVRVCPSDKTIG